MIKLSYIFLAGFGFAFISDQFVKHLSLNGLRYESSYIDLVQVFNDGVAFSMLSFLKDYLKYLHLALILCLFAYLLWQKSFFKEHLLAFSLIFGAGSSNLLDRFLYGGVVDMFYWHKWFNFAIFNVADVLINLGVALILIKEFFFKKKAIL
ncbi:signal peptidase II [Campylobacter troglodytis]|uniref:signal peptidase II n=1 Tax=Campylobacter troglodytis TaxID=654363 RepID=UPI00115883AB|nr:signal peptidase II [Campylobacter troglodytis]TQR53144.1 lipoprotein signal peptidase [Campylobacter troglodytis]